MESIMLCHDVKARNPYEIAGADISIFTIEELCYYLYHNLYLIDRKIMNEKLCEWIEKELKLQGLAEKLSKEVEFGLSLQGFILPIFEEIGYLNAEEMENIKKQLQIFKRQTEIERRKFKADNLIRNQRYAAAIYEYEQIRMDKKGEKLRNEFLGQIYHNMGTAYAHLFLYEKAAELFLEAHRHLSDEQSLKDYLNACYFFMDDEQFLSLVYEKEQYKKVEKELKFGRKIENFEDESKFLPIDELELANTICNWRKAYEKCIFG